MTISLLSAALSNDTTHKAFYEDLKTNPISVTRQTSVPPRTAAQILVTRTSSELLWIPPYFQCFSRHTTLAASEIMDVPPCQPFYGTLRSCLDRPRHLPKHMVVAHTELSSPTSYHYRKALSNTTAIEASEEHKFKTQSTETKAFNFEDTVGAVH